jgi:hypothetical protein
VSNATAAQSLTVNASGTSSAIGFTGVAGTSDAYSINFNAETTVTTAAPTAINAGIVIIDGIEAVTVNSGSAGGVNANAIDLRDTAATSLTIKGDQALDVTFGTAFGTTGATTGVATINASTATGAVDIDLANVKAATAGITVTGGTGADTITAQAATTQSFAGGAGKDLFEVALATGVAPIVTLTDLAIGDKIDFAGTFAPGALGAKVDVGAAANFAAALDIANGATVAAPGAPGPADEAQLVWFQYAGDTYAYADLEDAAFNIGTVDANDNIVKIAGLVDLAGDAYSAAGILTLA